MDEYGFLNGISDKTLYIGLTASEISLYAGEFKEAFNVSLPVGSTTFSLEQKESGDPWTQEIQ